MRFQALSFIIAVSISLSKALMGATYYVDAENVAANDGNDGSENAPFRTLARASASAVAGDLVRVKTGTYREILTPMHSGEKGRPITFEADGTVWIKGSDVVKDWTHEGNLWVKRPWKPRYAYEKRLDKMSSAPSAYSARREQVFVNGVALQWSAEKNEVQERSGFWWAPDGSELVIRLPEAIDPNNSLVEIPVRPAVVASWPATDIPRTFHEAEAARIAGTARVGNLPLTDWIVIRGFHFAHNVAQINRSGVRIQGRNWLLENNVIEWMNTIGVDLDDGAILRRNITRFNGQNGIGCVGGAANARLEDNTSLWDNSRDFRGSWGGAGIKLCTTDNVFIQNQIVLGACGPGLWFDADCRTTTVRDCVFFPNRQSPKNGSYGAIFHEISYDAQILNNVVFGNHNLGSLSVYGGGLTLSSSTNVKAEGNVIFFSEGGIGIPGGPRTTGGPNRFFKELETSSYWSKDLTLQDNLIVGDRKSALFARESSVLDPALKNKFSENILIGSNSGGKLRLADHTFSSFSDAARSFPDFIGTNASYLSLQDVSVSTHDKLNWAAGRLSEALVRTGVLEAPSSPFVAQDLWKFEGAEALGLFVRAGAENFLILDAPNDEEIKIFNSGRGQTRIWDSKTRAWSETKVARGCSL